MVSPWGPPTSSIMSEIYLQLIENTKIYDILRNSKVEGYFRHVDDIFLVYKDNLTNIEVIVNLCNNVSPGLLFTLQREQHGRISFPDLTITKGVSKLTFGIFRKPAATVTIIPNDSYRPLERKLAAIRYLANMIQTYTLDHLQKRKEIDIVKQIIHNNKYGTSILNRIKNNKKHKQGYKHEN
jgi:hypothetical protein